MFLERTLTRTFLKTDYSKYRAALLWSREECFIPQYQLKAENRLRAETWYNNEYKVLCEKEARLREELERLEDEINDGYVEYKRLLNGEVTEKKKFIRKCSSEGCKGWLSSSWKCDLCGFYTCKDCFVITDEKGGASHTCAPDDVSTATILRNSTRPCPKCGEAIEKSEGCDMMFCTLCHTPFEWSTGKIVTTGHIHNPHYYEWLRQTPDAVRMDTARVHGDIPCGGLPTMTFVRHFQTRLYKKVTSLYRLIGHVQDVELGAYNTIIQTREKIEDMMVNYLLNRETKAKIQTQLLQIEKKREKARAFYDVFHTFVTIGAEYMRTISEYVMADKEKIGDDDFHPVISDTIERMFDLIQFTNENSKQIGDLFGVSHKYIEYNLEKSDWSIDLHKCNAPLLHIV